MPSLVKLYNEFKDSEFVVLAIDIQESRETVKKYVAQAKMPFPVLMDFDGKVAYQYGVRAHWASTETRNLISFVLDQDQDG
jgi:peroxiredoxin